MRDLLEIQALFEQFNAEHFGGLVPKVEIHLSRRLKRAGQVCYETRQLDLSVSYHEKFGWGEELEKTLKHEMIHLYLATTGKDPGHTPEFKTWCKKTGAMIHCQDFSRPNRYVYGCPRGHMIYTKRKMDRSTSCVRCDKHYNPLFKIKLIKDLEAPVLRAPSRKRKKIHDRQRPLFALA